MIKVIDNYLPKDIFEELELYTLVRDFNIVDGGNKLFSVLETPEYMYEYLKQDGHDIVFSFIRSAYDGFDEELRVHADNIVNGHRVEIASVLYINDPSGVTSNGTAFYSHLYYGNELPIDCSNEEYDNVILKDANNKSVWKKTDYISSKPNRLLVYDANYFHSKYPSKIKQGVRKVLVTFYIKTKENE